MFFARWLALRFAVWCKARPGGLHDAVIDDILKGNAQATITKPQQSSILELRAEYQRNMADFASV